MQLRWSEEAAEDHSARRPEVALAFRRKLEGNVFLGGLIQRRRCSVLPVACTDRQRRLNCRRYTFSALFLFLAFFLSRSTSSVALATRTFAVGVAAGQVAFHQTAQRLAEGGRSLVSPWRRFRRARSESWRAFSFCHLTARIILPEPKNANANLANVNFPLSYLSYWGIASACGVPAGPAPAAGARFLRIT
jgi:hypothetical protein